ncbi:hypothetical protein NIES4101_46320 [Calothrix sp. NIES-4101]|nr:hypothetical protein NIES4101_46320 [Calothrix sp. NIES-4101]
MSTFVDDFGVWDVIGEMQANHQAWVQFPDIAFNASLFRFTFITNWDTWQFALDDRVYLIARFIYNSSPKQVSPSFKLIPKPEQYIRECSIPEKLIDAEVTSRRLEFKAFRYNRWISRDASIADIKLKAEYLL